MHQTIAVLIALAIPASAFAEGGCPPGQIPYSGTPSAGSAASMATCGPIPVNRAATPQWETRWGAIASGGAFGIVTDMKSERAAKKAAIAECQKRGGTTCGMMLAFRNQCAAVVSSSTKSFANGAAHEEDAVAAGQEQCKKSNTGECWVYYSGCSLPVQVR